MTHTSNMNIPIKQIKSTLNPKLQTHFKATITKSLCLKELSRFRICVH